MGVFGMIVSIFLIIFGFFVFLIFMSYKKTLLKRRFYNDSKYLLEEIEKLKMANRDFAERIQTLESIVTSESYELDKKFRSL